MDKPHDLVPRFLRHRHVIHRVFVAPPHPRAFVLRDIILQRLYHCAKIGNRCRHDGRGIGKARPDQARHRDLLGEIPQRSACMRMGHRKRGNAISLRPIKRHRQPVGKGRSGKGKSRIYHNRAGT